jgi:hypothetical protein
LTVGGLIEVQERERGLGGFEGAGGDGDRRVLAEAHGELDGVEDGAGGVGFGDLGLRDEDDSPGSGGGRAGLQLEREVARLFHQHGNGGEERIG